MLSAIFAFILCSSVVHLGVVVQSPSGAMPTKWYKNIRVALSLNTDITHQIRAVTAYRLAAVIWQLIQPTTSAAGRLFLLP